MIRWQAFDLPKMYEVFFFFFFLKHLQQDLPDRHAAMRTTKSPFIPSPLGRGSDLPFRGSHRQYSWKILNTFSRPRRDIGNWNALFEMSEVTVCFRYFEVQFMPSEARHLYFNLPSIQLMHFNAQLARVKKVPDINSGVFVLNIYFFRYKFCLEILWLQRYNMSPCAFHFPLELLAANQAW